MSSHPASNQDSDTVRDWVAADLVHAFLVRVLTAAGSEADSAKSVADALTEASLRGVDSHGIRLLVHYSRVVQTGRINPRPCLTFTASGPGTGIVDGDNGFGHHASFYAIDRAVELAAKTGIAGVSVTHSSHFGAAGCYVLKAAHKGFVALGTCNSDSFVLPHDGVQPFHGTNPIAFAAPVEGERPFLVDMASSVIPWNRVQDLRLKKRPMPADVSVDTHGDPTLDPELSAALLPLGGIRFGYKGAALAAIAEVLSAVVTGMPYCSQIPGMAGPDLSTPRHLGHFFLVLDPKRFVSTERYISAMRGYLQAIRGQPARAGRVMAPGDREWAVEAERRDKGIPIVGELKREFNDLAERLSIPGLQLR